MKSGRPTQLAELPSQVTCFTPSAQVECLLSVSTVLGSGALVRGREGVAPPMLCLHSIREQTLMFQKPLNRLHFCTLSLGEGGREGGGKVEGLRSLPPRVVERSGQASLRR